MEDRPYLPPPNTEPTDSGSEFLCNDIDKFWNEFAV